MKQNPTHLEILTGHSSMSLNDRLSIIVINSVSVLCLLVIVASSSILIQVSPIPWEPHSPERLAMAVDNHGLVKHGLVIIAYSIIIWVLHIEYYNIWGKYET